MLLNIATFLIIISFAKTKELVKVFALCLLILNLRYSCENKLYIVPVRYSVHYIIRKLYIFFCGLWRDQEYVTEFSLAEMYGTCKTIRCSEFLLRHSWCLLLIITTYILWTFLHQFGWILRINSNKILKLRHLNIC